MPPSPITSYSAVRAGTIIPLAGESAARGLDALTRPLEYIDDGIVLTQGTTILAVEPYRDYIRRPDALPVSAIHDLGDGLLVPGLINSHTHLEISHMAGKTVRGKGFSDWVSSLVALDKNPPESTHEAILNAVASLTDYGIAGVGDISSRMPQTVLHATRKSGIEARIFCEIIGHAPTAVDQARTEAETDPFFSLAGHAFYTTPGKTIANAHQWCVGKGLPFSLHLAEHEDEAQCLQNASGKLYELLRERVLPPSWRPPGQSPVQYAASLGLLTSGTLAVHCVHCDDADIATLAAGSAAICLCPRSNAYIAVGESPAKSFAEKGILLCLGTDSLASCADLDVWNEAEYFLKKNILPPKALLRMATVNGASVLGLSAQVGRLEKGMRFCYKLFPKEMTALFC